MNPIKAIVAATIALLTLLPLAGAQASTPPITPYKPYELKWILGPGQSSADIPFYNGYATVDLDDPSYPPRHP
jgi:hypothetical protein